MAYAREGNTNDRVREGGRGTGGQTHNVYRTIWPRYGQQRRWMGKLHETRPQRGGGGAFKLGSARSVQGIILLYTTGPAWRKWLIMDTTSLLQSLCAENVPQRSGVRVRVVKCQPPCPNWVESDTRLIRIIYIYVELTTERFDHKREKHA